MAINLDLMNFGQQRRRTNSEGDRTGFEALAEGTEQVVRGMNQKAAAIREDAANAEEQRRYNTKLISTGLQQLDTAIDNQEVRKQRNELFQLDKKAKQLANDYAEESKPLDLKIKQQTADQGQLDLQIKKDTFDRQKVAINAEETANINDAENDPKFKKPAGWDEMTAPQKSAYVAVQRANKTEKLKNRKMEAEISASETQAEIGKAKVELEGAKFAQDTATANAALVQRGKAMQTDPGIASLPDPNDKKAMARHEEAAKAFADIDKKADTSLKSRQSTYLIANVLGIQLDAEGKPQNPAQLEELDQMGVSGWMKNKMNDADRIRIKTAMGEYVKAAAQSKEFGALNFPPEIRRAVEQNGAAGLFESDGTLKDAVMEDVFGKGGAGKLQGFFNSQADLQKRTKQEAQTSFNMNAGYATIPKDQTYGIMYKLSTNAADNSMTPDQFRQMDPQVAANNVWGFKPGTNNPNYVVPEAYKENVNKENQARLGVLSQPAPFNYEFKSPLLKGANNVKNFSKTYATPEAQAGVNMNKPLLTTDGMNPINPNNVNSTQLVTYNPLTKSHNTVADHNGLPSAGATPQGSKAAESRDAIKKKYRFSDDELSGFSGMFSPMGGSK